MKFQRQIHIIASCLILGLYWLILNSGILINLFDKSMPAGIYIKSSQKAEKGFLAITCLTSEIAAYGLERGYLNKGRCPTGIRPVMKVVMAMEGDTISVDNGGVAINENFVEGCHISDKDSNNRPLQKFYRPQKFVLKKNEFWLISNHKPNSWDSRYWGAVPIEGCVKPILVINGKNI